MLVPRFRFLRARVVWAILPALAGCAAVTVAFAQAPASSPSERAARQLREKSSAAEVEAASERAKRAAELAEQALKQAEEARNRAAAAAAEIERILKNLQEQQSRVPAPSAAPPVAASPAAPVPARRAEQAAGAPRQPSPPTPPAAPPARAPAAATQPSPKAAGPVEQPVPAAPKPGIVRRVGPQHELKRPSDAARVAKPGDTVEIEAGAYPGDVAVWTQDGLTLRGVGGRVQLRAEGKSAESKGIWVIRGGNVTVENIEFSGARSTGHAGAGIHAEKGSLTIRSAKFSDNEIGISVDNIPAMDLVIENCEFAQSRNIRVGEINSFTLRGSDIRNARGGENVKSHARQNFVFNNRIMDEEPGSAARQLDFPYGHVAYIVGNIIRKGAGGDPSAISFAEERKPPDHLDLLYVVHNTIVSRYPKGTFVQNRGNMPALIANNIMVGDSQPVTGLSTLIGNLLVADAGDRSEPLSTKGKLEPGRGPLVGNWTSASAGFIDAKNHDYRLSQYSPAIDGATELRRNDPYLTPAAEYVHPVMSRPRKINGPADIGAYEHDEKS